MNKKLDQEYLYGKTDVGYNKREIEATNTCLQAIDLTF